MEHGFPMVLQFIENCNQYFWQTNHPFEPMILTRQSLLVLRAVGWGYVQPEPEWQFQTYLV